MLGVILAVTDITLGCGNSQLQEIRDEFLPRIGEHALGMELHSFDMVLLMAQTHDGASAVFFGCPGADFKLWGKIFFLHDQGMITGGRHRHRQTLKDGFVVVHDWAGFPVHEVRGADDAPAEGFADRLMPEANA